MARAIRTGVVSFGLVSAPVGLYSATEDHTVHFHQLQRGTADRIRNRRVNERTGDEVDTSDIVKGYEVGEGEYEATPNRGTAASPYRAPRAATSRIRSRGRMIASSVRMRGTVAQPRPRDHTASRPPGCGLRPARKPPRTGGVLCSASPAWRVVARRGASWRRGMVPLPAPP